VTEIDGRRALAICDVGTNVQEEISISFGGENFGWPFREGTTDNPGYVAIYGEQDKSQFTEPVAVVPYSEQPGAIICGPILPDSAGTDLAGKLLFSGFAWPDYHVLDLETGEVFTVPCSFKLSTMVSYGIDSSGEMFGVEYFGAIFGLRGVQNVPRFFETSESNGYVAQVFDNPALLGPPVLATVVSEIKFDWGTDVAFDLGWPDNFSVRFTRSFEVEETTTFQIDISGDDGYKLFIDQKLILDAWTPIGHEDSLEITLDPGMHLLTLEYFEVEEEANLHMEILPKP